MVKMMNSIAIFCGSALGSEPGYKQIAEKVGQTLAKRQQTLIYGGGRSGLMGIVADSALAAGARSLVSFKTLGKSRTGTSAYYQVVCGR